MSERKRHWPLWTAALIGLPVLYVASFGPACWMMSSKHGRSAPRIYKPIGSLISEGPEPIRHAIREYAKFGIPDGNTIFVPAGDGWGVIVHDRNSPVYTKRRR